jgi:hypothetical protein
MRRIRSFKISDLNVYKKGPCCNIFKYTSQVWHLVLDPRLLLLSNLLLSNLLLSNLLLSNLLLSNLLLSNVLLSNVLLSNVLLSKRRT